MEILTKAQVVKDVPARWTKQYETYDNRRDPSKAKITAALNALAPCDLTEERVNAIIGNKTWTTFYCDECGEKKDALMMMVDDTEWGGHKVGICLACLSAARSALGELK